MLESSGAPGSNGGRGLNGGSKSNGRSGLNGAGGESHDFAGLQETMAQTNSEVRTQSVVSILQLISSEEERLYAVEDKLDDLDDEGGGSRKRRLEQRAEKI